MFILDSTAMEKLGADIGCQLTGGEVIELVGDVGAGKTTLTRGIARGMMINDYITSPSFTINTNYISPKGLTLRHYDFYRLADAGIMNMEIAEATTDKQSVVIVEWADSVKDVLPKNRTVINIDYLADQGRRVIITGQLANSIDPKK